MVNGTAQERRGTRPSRERNISFELSVVGDALARHLRERKSRSDLRVVANDRRRTQVLDVSAHGQKRFRKPPADRTTRCRPIGPGPGTARVPDYIVPRV